MLQQEIKRVLMFLFAGGSEVDIREIFLFAEGTSQGYKGIHRYPSDWVVIIQEYALLLFGSLSPFLSAEVGLSCLSAVFIWFLASTEQQHHLLSGRNEGRLFYTTACLKV